MVMGLMWPHFFWPTLYNQEKMTDSYSTVAFSEWTQLDNGVWILEGKGAPPLSKILNTPLR